jgi:hypothetical protein
MLIENFWSYFHRARSPTPARDETSPATPDSSAHLVRG